MTPIDYDKITDEAVDALKSKKVTTKEINFSDIKISRAQLNNFSMNYDSIDFGRGAKKILHKLFNKLIRKTGLELVKEQNEINAELIKKIEELNQRILYLENKIEILQERTGR